MAMDKDKKKQEDEYFARIEFEQRQNKLKEKQHQMEQNEKTQMKDLHWMHCPKCGMEMIEIDFEGIKVDKCSSCLGLFFDNGEIDLLVEKNNPGFMGRLSSIFKS